MNTTYKHEHWTDIGVMCETSGAISKISNSIFWCIGLKNDNQLCSFAQFRNTATLIRQFREQSTLTFGTTVELVASQSVQILQTVLFWVRKIESSQEPQNYATANFLFVFSLVQIKRTFGTETQSGFCYQLTSFSSFVAIEKIRRQPRHASPWFAHLQTMLWKIEL